MLYSMFPGECTPCPAGKRSKTHWPQAISESQQGRISKNPTETCACQRQAMSLGFISNEHDRSGRKMQETKMKGLLETWLHGTCQTNTREDEGCPGIAMPYFVCREGSLNWELGTSLPRCALQGARNICPHDAGICGH